jgi:hypothetical protein
MSYFTHASTLAPLVQSPLPGRGRETPRAGRETVPLPPYEPPPASSVRAGPPHRTNLVHIKRAPGLRFAPSLRALGFYDVLWPRLAFLTYLPWRGPSLCAIEALRRSVCGATMSTSGGAGILLSQSTIAAYSVLGAPASLIGSELLSQNGSGPSLCPTPNT